MTWLELNSKAPFNDLCLLEFCSDVSSRSLSGLVTGNAYDRNDRELSLLRVTKKQLRLPYCLLPLSPHSGGTKLLCWEHPPVMGPMFLPYRLLASVQSGKSLQAQESPERLWPDALKGSAKVHVPTEPEARSHPGAQSWGTRKRVCACYCSDDLFAEKKPEELIRKTDLKADWLTVSMGDDFQPSCWMSSRASSFGPFAAILCIFFCCCC